MITYIIEIHKLLTLNPDCQVAELTFMYTFILWGSRKHPKASDLNQLDTACQER